MTLQVITRFSFLVTITLLALLSGALASAESVERTDANDRLTWRFAEFVGAFRSRNWDHVCSFVTDETQAGFGPGQSGCEAHSSAPGIDGRRTCVMAGPADAADYSAIMPKISRPAAS